MLPHETTKPLVLAITGASGAVYGVRLLQQLILAKRNVHLLISPSGAAVLAQELGLELGPNRTDIQPLLSYAWPMRAPKDGLASECPWKPLTHDERNDAGRLIVVHDYRNYMAPVASGSFLTDGMVICPCSGATVSGIVHASGNNLIQRAADVHLKEHRKLVLVPRETPMSVFQLENLHRAAQAGAIVMPAMPGWYHGVTHIVDLVDFMVARILDHLGIEHSLTRRWGDTPFVGNARHRESGDA